MGTGIYQNSKALCIAVGSGPAGHPAFVRSVQEVEKLLTSGCGFDPRRTSWITSGSHQKARIVAAFQSFAKTSSESDRVVIDISAHGFINRKGKAFLVTGDSRWPAKDGDPGLLALSSLKQLFAAIPARHKLMIVDACYSGELAPGLQPPRGTNQLEEVVSRPSAAIWVSSERGMPAFVDEAGGITKFHGLLVKTLHQEIQATLSGLEPLYLRQVENRVSAKESTHYLGSLSGTWSQMVLAVPRPMSVAQVAGAEGFEFRHPQPNWTPSDPETVRRAIQSMKTKLDMLILEPEKRALLQLNLGCAIWDRPDADRRDEDLREAISHIQHAATGLKAADKRLYALAQNNLGAIHRELSTGDRGENLQKAIAFFKEARAYRELTKGTDPVSWASTMNNLGVTYCELRNGNSNQNIQTAIGFLTQALMVVSKDKFPDTWALTMNNLGRAYSDLDTGDVEANLSKALKCYEEAKTVWTEKAFPLGWAMLQNNIGLTLSMRQAGNPNEVLVSALAHLRDAERIRIREKFPIQWASTQHSLGAIYNDHRLPGRQANVARSVEHFRKALEVRTRQHFAFDRALTEMNLGTALAEMSTWNPECAAEATKAFGRALEVFRFNSDPFNWASIQLNLGFLELQVSSFTKAVEYFHEALRCFTKDGNPYEWALAQHNIGNALSEGGNPTKDAKVAESIPYFQRALTVRTKEKYRDDWASTMDSLGMAFGNLPTGDPAENLKLAVRHLAGALEVRTLAERPLEWGRTQNNLGSVYSKASTDRPKNLRLALNHFGEVLKVANAESDLIAWGVAHFNIGDTWLNLPDEPKLDAAKQAVPHFLAILKEITIELPFLYGPTCERLGDAYAILGDKANAILRYKDVLKVLEKEPDEDRQNQIKKKIADLSGDQCVR